LLSGYALDQSRRSYPLVRFGEGIVGQAAAAKRSIFLSDIPVGYFNINTSFGAALPRAIIVVPFIFEIRWAGIIELGSVHEFTELQKQYVLLVLDSIAKRLPLRRLAKKQKSYWKRPSARLKNWKPSKRNSGNRMTSCMQKRNYSKNPNWN